MLSNTSLAKLSPALKNFIHVTQQNSLFKPDLFISYHKQTLVRTLTLTNV